MLMPEAASLMFTWSCAIRELLVSRPRITPEDRITGRKKIALTSALPLNSWFRISATKKLNTMIAKELVNILVNSSTSSLLKFGSTVSANLYCSSLYQTGLITPAAIFTSQKLM